MKHDQNTIEAAAAAIANARGNRRGAPSITNILEILPAHLKAEVMDDAIAVLNAITPTPNHRDTAVSDALVERRRQDEKWGEQNHDPITWSAILTEECGEFAEAALHHRFGGPAAEGLRTEAVQVAAVALQIVECIDRNAGKVGCALCDRGDGQLGHHHNCPNA